MFSRRRDASKVALAWLVARLKVGGYRLLDCQFMTEHLRSLGAVEISQEDYLAIVGLGGRRRCRTAPARSRRRGATRFWRGGTGAEFGALDRLLAADPARTVDGARLRMRHRAALGPDVVDRVLDDVERRRLLVEPAREAAAEVAVSVADEDLDEGAGQLLSLPRRGRLAGAQPDDDVLDPEAPGPAS
jgi:hypothetical protein